MTEKPKCEYGPGHGCECPTCAPPINHVQLCQLSLEDVASAALEFTFIQGSLDYTARELRQAEKNLHVVASIHRRRIEEKEAAQQDSTSRYVIKKVKEEGYGAIFIVYRDGKDFFHCDTKAEAKEVINEQRAWEAGKR